MSTRSTDQQRRVDEYVLEFREQRQRQEAEEARRALVVQQQRASARDTVIRMKRDGSWQAQTKAAQDYLTRLSGELEGASQESTRYATLSDFKSSLTPPVREPPYLVRKPSEYMRDASEMRVAVSKARIAAAVAATTVDSQSSRIWQLMSDDEAGEYRRRVMGIANGEPLPQLGLSGDEADEYRTQMMAIRQRPYAEPVRSTPMLTQTQASAIADENEKEEQRWDQQQRELRRQLGMKKEAEAREAAELERVRRVQNDYLVKMGHKPQGIEGLQARLLESPEDAASTSKWPERMALAQPESQRYASPSDFRPSSSVAGPSTPYQVQKPSQYMVDGAVIAAFQRDASAARVRAAVQATLIDARTNRKWALMSSDEASEYRSRMGRDGQPLEALHLNAAEADEYRFQMYLWRRDEQARAAAVRESDANAASTARISAAVQATLFDAHTNRKWVLMSFDEAKAYRLRMGRQGDPLPSLQLTAADADEYRRQMETLRQQPLQSPEKEIEQARLDQAWEQEKQRLKALEAARSPKWSSRGMIVDGGQLDEAWRKYEPQRKEAWIQQQQQERIYGPRAPQDYAGAVAEMEEARRLKSPYPMLSSSVQPAASARVQRVGFDCVIA